jgi:hypothetical protein
MRETGWRRPSRSTPKLTRSCRAPRAFGKPDGHFQRWERGGIRLIYYFWVEPNAVVLITAYPKNEKENLTDADKKEIRKLIESLKRDN